MKIAVFGANGGIGKFIVKHALDRGYEVNIYVRNSSKLALTNEKLTVFTGELSNYDFIKSAISGCDAVINAIGVPMKFSYDKMSSLEGHKNIIRAMQELGVSRLIDWATPSAKFQGDTRSFITVVPGIMASILFPKAKEEVIAICNAITNSNLDWTIVRFMAPKNTPYTGKIEVGFGDKKMNFNISREDIAAFMLSQVEDKTYLFSMPIIGSK